MICVGGGGAGLVGGWRCGVGSAWGVGVVVPGWRCGVGSGIEPVDLTLLLVREQATGIEPAQG